MLIPIARLLTEVLPLICKEVISIPSGHSSIPQRAHFVNIETYDDMTQTRD